MVFTSSLISASLLYKPGRMAADPGPEFKIHKKLSCLAEQRTPDKTPWSPGRLEDWAELLCEHHVARNLQLSCHECLHAIQLAGCHRHEVLIFHSDRHVGLVTVSPSRRTAPVLQVNAELLAIADHQLEDCTTHLHQFGSLRLHSSLDLVEDLCRHWCEQCGELSTRGIG